MLFSERLLMYYAHYLDHLRSRNKLCHHRSCICKNKYPLLVDSVQVPAQVCVGPRLRRLQVCLPEQAPQSCQGKCI